MGGMNSTDTARHAITFNVCRSYMRQRFDYPRLVGDETLAHLGEIGPAVPRLQRSHAGDPRRVLPARRSSACTRRGQG